MNEENKLLRNGKVVDLKNPGTKALKDFLVLAKAMSKIPKDKPDEFMEHLDSGAMDAAINLVNMTVRKTYVDYDDDDDAWTTENFMLILPKVIEMCSPKQGREDKKKSELFDRLNKQG